MFFRIWTFLLLSSLVGFAVEPPTVPVGLDAYRQWDKWPQQRIGVRAYMRSTYDRRGGNEGADASHFLYQLADDKNVSLHVEGPGVLYFARYNHWHGSPWHYEVDGIDHIVQESSTANPNKPVEGSVFIPEKLFPEPLAWTWSATKGADLSWVPIPFEQSFRMMYSRTHYGTGYYIYHQFVDGIPLSQPIRSWSESKPLDRDVLELIAHSGSDLLPPLDSPLAKEIKLRAFSGSVDLAPGEKKNLGPLLVDKPRMFVPVARHVVRALEFSAPRDRALEFGRVRLRVKWDTAREPSIDAPMALFFGAGTLYNRDDREFLVKAFPMNIRYDANRVYLSCYFPMPFFEIVELTLENTNGEAISNIHWSMRVARLVEPEENLATFHATYQDFPKPVPGEDLVLLDTRKTEGGGDWSGHFVGTSFIFSDRAFLGTLEGDPRFFFDDSETPQGQGTGTEEWGGGGDYWGGRNMTLPFAGHPCGARSEKEAKCDEDKIESAYRFLLADLMPFGKNAVIRLEHGAENQSTEYYQTVTYWYGVNKATLVKTDSLQMGDEQSEKAHRYISPDASAPYEITSRYEWGVDTFSGKEVFPTQKDVGRKTAGVSEFNLKLNPKNLGVMLRRKLDYQFPNQRAEIFVAPVKNGKAGKFQKAGVWFLAGGNTCVYSNPKEELGAAQHNAQTSNRRFRDDEFLVSKKLTEGRSEIRVRVEFAPVKIPLFPGAPLPELAWSEIRYDAYCYVMP